MSLPLWEECAWYVDVPEIEVEQQFEPNCSDENCFKYIDHVEEGFGDIEVEINDGIYDENEIISGVDKFLTMADNIDECENFENDYFSRQEGEVPQPIDEEILRSHDHIEEIIDEAGDPHDVIKEIMEEAGGCGDLGEASLLAEEASNSADHANGGKEANVAHSAAEEIEAGKAEVAPPSANEASPLAEEANEPEETEELEVGSLSADHVEEAAHSEYLLDAPQFMGYMEEQTDDYADVDLEEEEYEDEDVPEPIQYTFPINKEINKRMYLYLGEIYKIPCDAIVIGQVESLTDRLDGNDAIFTLAGVELEPELAQLAPCTTGDSVISRGWQMPCEWIIHSVGPKYDERYLEASDHALFSAYKSALLLAAQRQVQRLVLGTVYKASKKYPRFEAAHVALRTVRKFLEHAVGDVFERVMFCVNTQEDFEIYSALMHAYFPRSQEELEDQRNLLPIELGDEWGEVILPDRVLKVSVGPKPLPVESLQQYKASEETKDHAAAASFSAKTAGGSVPRGAAAPSKKLGNRDIKAIGEGPPRPMTHVDHDPDYERKKKIAAEFAQMSREERLRLRFQVMAKELEDEEEQEDLAEMDALHLLHVLGKDFKERTVVYLSGAALMRAESMDPHRVLLYLMKQMEPLRCVPFVLIYGCATLGDERYPDTSFMQSIFDLYGCRYNDTLLKFYILHASFSFRMYFWLLLPLETTTFWSSYTNLSSIRSMHDYMDVASLDIPSEVQRYDEEHYSP